jgi:C1A family cysteine protease
MMRKLFFAVVGLALLFVLLLFALFAWAEEPEPQSAPMLPPPPEPRIRTGFILPEMELSHLTGRRMPEKFVWARKGEPQSAPTLPPPPEPCTRTGFIPPEMDLSHLTGRRMPEKFMVQQLPDVWDWRTQGKVTSVKDQGPCGSCYAFGAIANIESRIMIEDAATPPDLSENNAKECNWPELNDYCPGGNCWGSCDGGNYLMLANLFSQKGTVDESCDPYTASDVDCTTTCTYTKTLLDWRIISGGVVPATNVLKAYIYNYGPIYTTLHVGTWVEFRYYDGSYTLHWPCPDCPFPDHAVLIVGWSNNLPPVKGGADPAEGWIVKNSWGTGWGDDGYFYITYGSANIGMYSSFMLDSQDYDLSGDIMYYDDDGWSTRLVYYGTTTCWGLCKFIPVSDTYVTRVEFWTIDLTTDVDVYIYDDFDGTALSGLLRSVLNLSFDEAGYHSVELPLPLPVRGGDDVVAVVKFTNDEYWCPIPADNNGPPETGRTYVSPDGSDGSWYDLGEGIDADVAIRLRTSTAVTLYGIYLPTVFKNFITLTPR